MAKKSASRTQTGVISWSIGTPRTEKSPRYATFHIAVGPLRPCAGAHSLSAYTGYRPIWWLRPGGIPWVPRCPGCAEGVWGSVWTAWAHSQPRRPVLNRGRGWAARKRLKCAETAHSGRFCVPQPGAAARYRLPRMWVRRAVRTEHAFGPGGRQGRGANRKDN